MCGICGIWYEREIDAGVLRRMADTLQHRGPDSEGHLIAPPVGFASRRLSIIDVPSGQQPISNEDGTVHVVFNGEIYNYRRIRKELLQRGHRFATSTDTEVLVHLYEEEGVRCVNRLRGMFAFAIWDSRERQLFVARDHLGQKPLYYYWHNGCFLFASEIKALLTHPSVSANLDLKGLDQYLSLRCVPDHRTLFSGIHKLPAAHYLVLNDGRLRVEKYWDLHYEPKVKADERDLVDQLRELLEETIQSHLVSDVPVGAFLSGGIDSSVVVAVMTKALEGPVTTFSVGAPDESFNELPYARVLAEHCRTDHHEALVGPGVLVSLPRMIQHMEEPVDPFAFGVYHAAGLAQGHVKVLLGGDGGDEMFAGYDRYLGNQLVDMYCFLPRVFRRQLLEPLFERLPDTFRYNNRVQKLRWLAAMSRFEGGDRYVESAGFLRFTHERKQELYTRRMWREVNGSDAADSLLQYYNGPNAVGVIDRMLYADVKTRLPDHLLMVADRMTMAHGIEGRSPFVDQAFAEFAARLPAEFKIRRRRLKYLLRRAAEELIPISLVHRRKQGFSFPLAIWFKSRLATKVASVFEQSRLVAAGYFRQEALMRLIDEHTRSRVDHNYRLWLLLNLELWYRHFIEGEPIESLSEVCSFSSIEKPKITVASLVSS